LFELSEITGEMDGQNRSGAGPELDGEPIEIETTGFLGEGSTEVVISTDLFIDRMSTAAKISLSTS